DLLELLCCYLPLVRQIQRRQRLVREAADTVHRLVERAIPDAVDDVDLPARPTVGELYVLEVLRAWFPGAFEVPLPGQNAPPLTMRPVRSSACSPGPLLSALWSVAVLPIRSQVLPGVLVGWSARHLALATAAGLRPTRLPCSSRNLLW